MIDTKSDRRWGSLLDGSLHDRTVEVNQAICAALRDPLADLAMEDVPESATVAQRASLSGGWAGLAVFFGYQALAGNGKESAALAVQFLDRATNALAKTRMGPSFYSGFPGIAWAVSHLEGSLLESGSEDSCEEIDQALQNYLEPTPWTGHYDLVSGLVGLGVYALERLPRPRARRCLELVVERLAEAADEHPDGLTWHSRPEYIGPYLREKHPDGLFNLGVAHGVPGVIAFLGAVCREGVACKDAERMLHGAVSWLLGQTLPPGSPSRFPFGVDPNVTPMPSRSAWCYGDPGVASALLGAALSLDEPSWRREAVSIAIEAARRPPQQTGVQDAGLCHGAAGLAHLYNRMYQSTGEEELAKAARHWYGRTLAMRSPGKGLAGYQARTLEDGSSVWRDAPGLLCGASGTGLALLAATTEIAPAWDRMLLLSIPPRSS